MHLAQRSWILGGILALLVLVTLHAPASACSCNTHGETPQQNRDRSTAVFSMRVVDISPIVGQPGMVRIDGDVIDSWLGVTTARVSFQTADNGAQCGFAEFFDKTQEYLVYAHGEIGDLYTTNCDRTRFLSQAAEDLVALGPATMVPTETESWTVVKSRF